MHRKFVTTLRQWLPQGTNGRRRNWHRAFHRDDRLPGERRRVNGFVGFCGCCGCFRQVQGVPHAKLQFLLSACAIGEPPFLCCGRIEQPPQQANGSLGVYVEGNGFCLRWGPQNFIFVASVPAGNLQQPTRRATSGLARGQTGWKQGEFCMVCYDVYELGVRPSGLGTLFFKGRFLGTLGGVPGRNCALSGTCRNCSSICSLA